MSIRAAERVETEPESIDLIDRLHPVRRAGFVALVFCGHSEAMSELAGESTAGTQSKFVLADPTLDPDVDFAQSSGATLPAWPMSELRPVPGVCFVFSNADSFPARQLMASGGVRGEHFVIVKAANEDPETLRRTRTVRSLVRRLLQAHPRPTFGVLGFGHQGQQICRTLLEEHGVAREQLIIWDTNSQSAAEASLQGLKCYEDEAVAFQCHAIIASPLRSTKRIHSILAEAEKRSIPYLNNADTTSGMRTWSSRGRLMFDEAAGRALQLEGSTQVCCSDSVLRPMLCARVVRHDRRVLGGRAVLHLHSGQQHCFASAPRFDIAERWIGDGLAPDTWQGLERAFVSIQDGAGSAIFAAKEFCTGIWPYATENVLPASHAVDLGMTSFERLLRAHLDHREIVSSMQTPLQRVALGVAAAHFSASRPIIEIGSAFGGSALHLAAATEEGAPPIISIDPDSPTRDIMRFAFERHGFGPRLRQVVQLSDDAIDELVNLKGQCGLVFVDGQHTAEAVRNDFANYAPLVAPGGAMAFHDVCPALHSVLQAIMEHVLPDPRFTPICLVDGLLILERVNGRSNRSGA